MNTSKQNIATYTLFLLMIQFFLVGCASNGVSRDNLNDKISITYATVVKVDEVKLKSDVGKATAVGGLWGLAANSKGNREDMAEGALAGALVYGLTTKIFEGSNRAYAYTLRDKNNNEFKVNTEQGGIHAEDCVSVESGNHTNIRRVSSVYCQPSSAHAYIEQDIHTKLAADAAQCHDAKEQLLKASEDQMDAWIRKVKALCDG